MDANRKNIPLFSLGSLILLLLIAVGAVAAYFRFAHGLGASTDLKDNFPWGLWIGFDVVSGVALAAGGFTIAAATYIFNMKKYKPIARPAILTAFIGYLMVIVGLVIDIGQPTRFWHPFTMWQHRSVLFEVFWCISLYTTVLSLEFAPVVLERLGWTKLLKVLKFFTFPLVIAGIILSFLHQSSLGAFFLIAPAKLSRLWYSPIMPQLFFLSAVSLGLATVAFESTVSAAAFKTEPEREIIRGLGKGTAIALLVYLIVRIADLLVRGAMPLAFNGSTESKYFLAEIGLGVILPMVLLFIRQVRESTGGSLFSVSVVMAGVIFNRFNVTFFSQTSSGASYLPTWREFAITIGLISLGIFLYKLAVKLLPILPEVEAEH